MTAAAISSVRPRQRGLSLVELMVALALSSIITVGIIQMFTAHRATYSVNTAQARMQENGRMALEFIVRPARMAGFAGCFRDTESIRETLAGDGDDMLDDNDPAEFNVSDGIAGHEATTASDWSPDLSSLPDDIDTAAIAGGTDVLILRSVSSENVRLDKQMPNSSADLKTTIPDQLGDFEEGAILMVSDCEKATVFQVTDSNISADQLNVVHNTGASTAPGNSTKDLTGDDTVFDTDATVHRVVSNYFFIAPGAGTNNAGQTPLSLWRKQQNSPPVELVEGVQDLQLLYGEDTDSDGVPNRYRTIQNFSDADARRRIVTIRVALTADSVDEVPVDDGGNRLLTREFSKTIAVRNR